MKNTISEYMITLFNDGTTKYRETTNNVLIENEKQLVYEDSSKEYEIVHKNEKSLFYGIEKSLDKPLVSEGSYYAEDHQRKQGVCAYLFTHKDKDEALSVIKNAVIERFSWMNKENIENAFKNI